MDYLQVLLELSKTVENKGSSFKGGGFGLCRSENVESIACDARNGIAGKMETRESDRRAGASQNDGLGEFYD